MTRDLGPSLSQVARMRGNITTLILAAQRRRRRRPRPAPAATASVVAASLTAGIVANVLPDEIVAGVYVCFTADDTRSTSHGMPYPLDLEPPQTTEAQVEAALIACDDAFAREGVLAPDPTVCRLADLRLGVFPNLARLDAETLCSSLGLLEPED